MLATPTPPTISATAPRPRNRPVSALCAWARAISAADGWLTSTSDHGVIVSKPAKPGKGRCVVCVVHIKGRAHQGGTTGTGPVTAGAPGSGTVTTGPGTVTTGSGPVTTGSGSGTVTTSSGSGTVTTGSGSGTVTIGSGSGTITISQGGTPPVGVCPAPPGKPRPRH